MISYKTIFQLQDKLKSFCNNENNYHLSIYNSIFYKNKIFIIFQAIKKINQKNK